MKQRCVSNEFSINDRLEVFDRDLLYEMERRGKRDKQWRHIASSVSTKFRKIDMNKMNGKFQAIRKSHDVYKDIASRITRMF